MKFIDLHREYELFDWRAAIDKVVGATQFIGGSYVSLFEQDICKYLGVPYATGVSSGTDALQVAFLAYPYKPLSECTVLTTPYSFIATVEVPARLGARFLFCELDQDFNLDLDQVKEKLSTEDIDIFLPVHLFGNPFPMDEELLNICKNRDVFVIEDCAQSLGSMWDGKYTGTHGDISCFSFFPAKNLGCAGDGGMVVTNNTDIDDSCKMIRNHGSRKKDYHEVFGGNFRLDSLQAALLSAKLPLLDSFVKNRIASAKYFSSQLNEVVNTPSTRKKALHSYNQYVITCEDRDLLKDHLKDSDIPTAVYYPSCLTTQPCFENLSYRGECANSHLFSRTNLALPIAHLNDDERDLVVREVKKFYA